MEVLPVQQVQQVQPGPRVPPVAWQGLRVAGGETDIEATQNLDKGTVYLIEGTCDSATKKYLKTLLPDIPDTFFEMQAVHTLSRIEDEIDNTRMLITKWSRVANQVREVWIREKRLRDGNPFNVNHHDPAASSLDHEKLVHTSRPYRPYDPIFEYTSMRETASEHEGNLQRKRSGHDAVAADDPEMQKRPRRRTTVIEPSFQEFQFIRHTVRDSLCMYHGVDVTGQERVIVLSDPVHSHQRIKVKYSLWAGGEPSQDVINGRCFENDESTRTRLLMLLEASLKHPGGPSSLVTWVRDAIVCLILSDETRLMVAVGRALDEMELAMATKTYDRWRTNAPAWRNHLYHQLETLSYLEDVLEGSELLSRVRSRRTHMESLARRLDSSFQTLTATMSIIESGKAIQQAEEVTRLTNLAFFFIPLSLVASVFGMNVIEFDQRLTSWMWLSASLFVTFLTYSVRFRRPISHAIVSTPETVRTLRWGAAFALSRRVAQLVRPWVILLIFLGSMAGFAAGLWLVATHSGLSSDARIGIGTALAVVPPLFYCLRFLKMLSRPESLPQLILIFVISAAWGAALWGLATTRALETNDKIAAALSIIGLQFSSSGPSSAPIVLVGILYRGKRPLTAKRITTRMLRAILRLAFLATYGVVLWRLFVSSALTDIAKIGIAIGVAGVVPLCIGTVWKLALQAGEQNRWPPEDDTDDTSGHWLFSRKFLLRLAGDLMVMGVCGAVSPAVWKLSTSQLGDGTKVAIGIGAVCVPCGLLNGLVGYAPNAVRFAYEMWNLDLNFGIEY
ncbi:hypothetical protein B0T14DRAFT_596948 [Immersiella caudata]|uniref:Uncharacterized protein n=1 Tax=Immersiella caudata TaxID=314043 RepID=A0AA39XC70_9PEZI|nr:hypothetical protein B0T14DRAFT_596948 [Immersiella caudata]